MPLAAHQLAFLGQIIPAAVEACVPRGVPPQVCVAQAVFESGWGKSAPYYNYFGLHGTGNDGSFVAVTAEYTGTAKDGGLKAVKVPFAKYKTAQDGVAAYAERVTRGTFSGSTAYADDPAAFVVFIWGRGYATDIDYPAHIAQVGHSIANHSKELPEGPYRAFAESCRIGFTPELAAVVKQLQAVPAGTQRRKLTTALMPEAAKAAKGGSGWGWAAAGVVAAILWG